MVKYSMTMVGNNISLYAQCLQTDIVATKMVTILLDDCLMSDVYFAWPQKPWKVTCGGIIGKIVFTAKGS